MSDTFMETENRNYTTYYPHNWSFEIFVSFLTTKPLEMKSLSILGLGLYLGLSLNAQAQRISIQDSPSSPPHGDPAEAFSLNINISTCYSEYFSGVIPVFVGVEFSELYTLEIGVGLTREAKVGLGLVQILSLREDFNRTYTPGPALYVRNKFYTPELKLLPMLRNTQLFGQIGGSFKSWNYSNDPATVRNEESVQANWYSTTLSGGLRRHLAEYLYMETSYGLSYTSVDRIFSIPGEENQTEVERFVLPSIHMSVGVRF